MKGCGRGQKSNGVTEIFRCHPHLGLKNNKQNFIFNASRDWKLMEMFLDVGGRDVPVIHPVPGKCRIFHYSVLFGPGKIMGPSNKKKIFNFFFFLLFITVSKESYGIVDKNILCRIKNIFSLFHQRADDEALTRFLQTSVFLVASPILVKSMFFSFRSSLTLSIQVFLCLPLLLFPSTCPCKAAFGNLFSSTCPNHCSLLFLIFCTTVSSAPSSSLVCSFLTFSLLLLPMILLSQLISATNSLRSSSFLRLQHSEPYSKTGTTRA